MTGWRRAEIFWVPPEPEAEKLLRLAATLDDKKILSDADRHDASAYLRRLAWSPKALAAINTQRGRARSLRAGHVALDYLIHRELQGKASAAVADVARGWGLKDEQYVKDAWTQSQRYARYELEQLLRMADESLTRTEVLLAISAELRARHAKQGRKK